MASWALTQEQAQPRLAVTRRGLGPVSIGFRQPPPGQLLGVNYLLSPRTRKPGLFGHL